MDLTQKLQVGMEVMIQRTDGRVHVAVITSVSAESNVVTVEWYEKSETKGKEVDINAILSLNPLLAPSPNEEVEIKAGNRLARNSTKASIPVATNNSKGSYRAKNASRPTNIMPAVIMGPPAAPAISSIPVAAVTAPATPCNPVINKISSVKSNIKPPAQISSIPLQQSRSQQSINESVSDKRRSNVVKEVEKLKKNREERRTQQAEKKKEKVALMNVDPGNQHWEFAAMIREYRGTIDFQPLANSDPITEHQITVCVRKRPLNKAEKNRKEIEVVTVPTGSQIIVHEPKNKVDLTKYLDNQMFRFDYAFDDECGNDKVYRYTAGPLVQTIFEGGMATVFAYGQTGSGKTHTMGGDFNGKTQNYKKGIYALAAKDVFRLLHTPRYKALNLTVSASFFEIYSGKVFDLLADKAKLRILEDGKGQVKVVGLSEVIVNNVEDVFQIIQKGNATRTSGQTSANSNSSRSHAVFQIILSNPLIRNNDEVHGKFSFIDLAGNERGADTQSSNRQTRMEGSEINKSLLALKECIRALGRNKAHLPFRASKLTQVLRDSFIHPNSKTCMIAMISPGMSSVEHSLNTLRYADRVKELAPSDPTERGQNSSSPVRKSSMAQNGNSHEVDDEDMDEDGELADEMLSFHDQINEVEDEVLDHHKFWVENLPGWSKIVAKYYNQTRNVDFDRDAYLQGMKDFLTSHRDKAAEFLEKLNQFEIKLSEEEKFSQLLKSKQKQRQRR